MTQSKLTQVNLSLNLKSFLENKGKGSEPNSVRETGGTLRRHFDGVLKSKHPIYPVWRKMIDTHCNPKLGTDKVHVDFQNFASFWQWYREQVKHIPDHLNQKFKIIRVNKKYDFCASNCKLVSAAINNPLNVSNHLTLSQVRDFEAMIELGQPIQLFAEYFGWSKSKAGLIVKNHLSNLQNQEKLQETKESSNIIGEMMAQDKKRKFNA